MTRVKACRMCRCRVLLEQFSLYRFWSAEMLYMVHTRGGTKPRTWLKRHMNGASIYVKDPLCSDLSLVTPRLTSKIAGLEFSQPN